MEPHFSKAVDPVFLGVIELLERVKRNVNSDPQQERAEIKGLLTRAEAALGPVDEWELAKYALVSWIDSALIEAPWDGAKWWEDHLLEREYFFDRVCFTEFYVRAQQAGELPKKNALEVFYVCVVMGFRGLYADASSMQLAGELGLPENLDAWARATSMSLHLGIGRPPIQDRPQAVGGAPPLDGKSSLLLAAIFALVTIALPLGFYLMKLME